MKNKSLLLILLSFASMFFSEATLAQSEYYTPKALIIPLHDQKKQLHLSVGRGGGYDVNVSYAFTDKLAVFSTATFDNDTKKRTSIFGDRYNVDRNDYVLRGGLGYFTKTESNFFPVLEFYAGAGISNIDNFRYFSGDPDGTVTQAKYWTTYAQVQAGKKLPKADYGFGLRVSYSRYTQFEYYGTEQSERYRRFYFNDVWGLTAEPGFSFSYKIIRDLKLNLQTGIALPVFLVERQHYIKIISGDETFAGNGIARLGLFAFTGRLSLQYTLNFTKRDD